MEKTLEGFTVRLQGVMLKYYTECKELMESMRDTKDPGLLPKRCEQLLSIISKPEFIQKLKNKKGASEALCYVALGLYGEVSFKKNAHHLMRASLKLIDCSKMKIEDVMDFIEIKDRSLTILAALIHANDNLVKKALFCLYCLKSENIVEQNGETLIDLKHYGVIDCEGACEEADESPDDDKIAALNDVLIRHYCLEDEKFAEDLWDEKILRTFLISFFIDHSFLTPFSVDEILSLPTKLSDRDQWEKIGRKMLHAAAMLPREVRYRYCAGIKQLFRRDLPGLLEREEADQLTQLLTLVVCDQSTEGVKGMLGIKR